MSIKQGPLNYVQIVFGFMLDFLMIYSDYKLMWKDLYSVLINIYNYLRWGSTIIMASFSDMTNWQNWSPTFAKIYLDVSRSSPSCATREGSQSPIAMLSLCCGLRKPSTRRTPFLVKASLLQHKSRCQCHTLGKS